MKAKIGIHHTGGLGNDNNASSAGLTLLHINNAHKARWPELKSRLGFYVGYSMLIFPDGSKVQTRLIGEETAAAKGSNFDSFHICLIGNFNKFAPDRPSEQQLKTLKEVLRALIKGTWKDLQIGAVSGISWEFSEDRTYPHRVLHPNHTDCYGTSLSDEWCKQMAKEATKDSMDDVYIIKKSSIKRLVELLYKVIIDFLEKEKFGRMEYDINDHDDTDIDYSKFIS